MDLSLIKRRKVKSKALIMNRRKQPHYNTKREYENLINEIRLEKGLTIFKLAQKAGIIAAEVQKLAQGLISPIDCYGALKPWVSKLCEALESDPYDVFPREVCYLTKHGITPDQFIDMWYPEYPFLNEEYIITAEQATTIDTILSTLPQREKNIILDRFYHDKTLQGIGNKLGITRERVRLLESNALRDIRKHKLTKDLRQIYYCE